MPDAIDGSIDAFLAAVSQLSAEQFAAVANAGRAMGSGPRKEARKAAKPSASELSALDKRVRDTIQPIADRLGAIGTGSVSAATTDTMLALHGLLKRDRLTADQYEALVGPFRGQPVPIPVHDA